MPQSHQFTRNYEKTPIDIVIGQIQTFSYDDFSKCTTIQLVGGEKIGVSESLEEVRRIVNGA